MAKEKAPKLGLVFGSIPTPDEIDQFQLISKSYDVTVITSESISDFIKGNCRFPNLRCLALPDHDENPTYIPGLENVLGGFDLVLVKERLGLYAYQVVKAKWRNKFRLLVWVDNISAFPAEDVNRMRTVRYEVSNAADAFIVQSQAARDMLLLEGIEKERIHSFIPYVQQVARRSKKARAEALQKLSLPEGCILIAHLGQVEWEEGLGDLASAIKLASVKDASLARRLRLVICGVGSYANQLRETLVAHGIDDKVVFVTPSREAHEIIYQAADFLFLASIPARDRIEGDPYRILTAMVHEIPVIANRSPIIEEYSGKHRIDYCTGSASSLAAAIGKAVDATALRNDIVKKNASVAGQKYTNSLATEQMIQVLQTVASRNVQVASASIDRQIIDAEALVSSKQYLRAVDTIESIFKEDALPVHHKSNLYRLVGDSFAKLGDNDRAKDSYTKAVELDPYSSRAFIGLGTVALVKKSFDVAVLHFQKAVSLAPNDEMATLGLGLAFQGLDENAEAQIWVSKSLQINPENTAALYTIVRLAYDSEVYATAEKALEAYMAKHPHDHNMGFTLAGIKYKLAKFSETLDLCKAITDLDPMDGRAHALQKKAQKALESARSSEA